MEIVLSRFAVAVTCLGTVCAQNLSLGIAAGGAPTDAFEASANSGQYFRSESPGYLVGATLEYYLPQSFSIEVDALFRELRLTDIAGTQISPMAVVTWEFPVLAKYRFHGTKLTPFLEAGPAFRSAGNLNEANPSHAGFTAGAGVETHWRGLEFAPTLRYTRWARDDNSSGPDTKPDQLEILLGIGSRPRSPGNLLGQHFSLGAIAGVTLTHDLSNGSMTLLQPPSRVGELPTPEGTQYVSGAASFLAGPALEMKLSQRFYVEADAVHHSIRSTSKVVLTNGVNVPSISLEPGTWEFPALAKFKFGSGRLKPFAEAGPSFRIPVNGLSPAGFTAGGGVELRWRVLKLAPAIRYTRWGQSNSFDFGPQQLQPNQVEFLMGFLL